MTTIMGIGVIARRTGVSPETIRYYEKEGLLPPADRSEGGHRRYGEDHLKRLIFIVHARELGFSEIFQMVTAPQINVARNDPRFRVLLEEMANDWIVRLQGRDNLSQTDSRYLGVAYYALGDEDAAIEALEAGIAHGGPYVPVLEADIQTVRKRPLYPDSP